MWNQYYLMTYFNYDSIKVSVLPFVSARYTIKYTEPYESEIHNELREINLYMNMDISNWHVWSIDPTKMKFLPFFQLYTRLLTSKHTRFISTLLQGWNGEMWKVAFQLIKIRKMNMSRNIKIKHVSDFFLSIGSSRMKFILVIRGWAHKSQKDT